MYQIIKFAAHSPARLPSVCVYVYVGVCVAINITRRKNLKKRGKAKAEQKGQISGFQKLLN
jgi:hypothetical protein